MPLLGQAAVAMWWNIATEQQQEFGDWHSHEHFPERMSIPGFLRGSRWSSTTEQGGYFVLYELSDYETLTSQAYLQRLNNPTPWSTKMMPHHLHMVRSQSRVLATYGGGVASSLVTLRFSPERGAEKRLEQSLGEVLARIAGKPGLTGAHLLRTDTPNREALTTEQKIRGGDATADWIVLVSGYDGDGVRITVQGELTQERLREGGVKETPRWDEFRLSFALTAYDL